MPELSNRVQTFTDSVIRRMTRISDEYGAINLSQSFPDFDPPIRDEALCRLGKMKECFRYKRDFKYTLISETGIIIACFFFCIGKCS